MENFEIWNFPRDFSLDELAWSSAITETERKIIIQIEWQRKKETRVNWLKSLLVCSNYHYFFPSSSSLRYPEGNLEYFSIVNVVIFVVSQSAYSSTLISSTSSFHALFERIPVHYFKTWRWKIILNFWWDHRTMHKFPFQFQQMRSSGDGILIHSKVETHRLTWRKNEIFVLQQRISIQCLVDFIITFFSTFNLRSLLSATLPLEKNNFFLVIFGSASHAGILQMRISISGEATK